MRTREEIEKQTQVGAINEYDQLRVHTELLLDIRDLLKPISDEARLHFTGANY